MPWISEERSLRTKAYREKEKTKHEQKQNFQQQLDLVVFTFLHSQLNTDHPPEGQIVFLWNFVCETFHKRRLVSHRHLATEHLRQRERERENFIQGWGWLMVAGITIFMFFFNVFIKIFLYQGGKVYILAKRLHCTTIMWPPITVPKQYRANQNTNYIHMHKKRFSNQ